MMDIRERMQQLIGDYAGTENLRVVDVERLKEIEWSAAENVSGLCPACFQYDHEGHVHDCWLAKLIGEEANDGDQR